MPPSPSCPARERLFTPLESVRGHRVMDYSASPKPTWPELPPVGAAFHRSWWAGTTPPAGRGGSPSSTVHPARTIDWLGRTVASIADVREEERLLVILAWNEWAEGNHLEPDHQFGRGFLEATRAVLLGGPGVAQGGLASEGATTPVPDTQMSYSDTFALAARLLPMLSVDHRHHVVDVGPDPLPFAAACRVLDVGYEPIALTATHLRKPRERPPSSKRRHRRLMRSAMSAR